MRRRSAATRRTGSRTPTRRPTWCSPSSATTNRMRERPASRRSSSSWATGSRRRWPSATTARPRRASSSSRRSRTKTWATPICRTARRTINGSRCTRRAMGEVAKAQGVTFVDLYTPSLQLYTSSQPPLTINGVHLNTEGNRRIARSDRPRAVRRAGQTCRAVPDRVCARRSPTRTSTGFTAIGSPTATRRTATARS